MQDETNKEHDDKITAVDSKVDRKYKAIVIAAQREFGLSEDFEQKVADVEKELEESGEKEPAPEEAKALEKSVEEDPPPEKLKAPKPYEYCQAGLCEVDIEYNAARNQWICPGCGEVASAVGN